MANVTPASRIERFTVTVPAGTPKATPQVTDLGFRAGDVAHVEIDVPTGHNALTGIQLWVRGGQQIPLTAGSWFTTSGRTFEWNLVGMPNSGSWQAHAYNTDIFPHSFYVTFSVVDFGGAIASGPPLPLEATPSIV